MANKKPIVIEEQQCIYPELGNCHICTSHTTTNNKYPVCRKNGKLGNMSRHIWEEQNGTIPKGMQVCHKCDTPACVNIEHLFLGTAKDNAADKFSKNRQGNVGKRKPRAVVIGGSGTATYTVKEVAEFLNLSYRTILKMIKSGEIKACKIGHKVYRVSEEELKKIMNTEDVNNGNNSKQ